MECIKPASWQDPHNLLHWKAKASILYIPTSKWHLTWKQIQYDLICFAPHNFFDHYKILTFITTSIVQRRLRRLTYTTKPTFLQIVTSKSQFCYLSCTKSAAAKAFTPIHNLNVIWLRRENAPILDSLGKHTTSLSFSQITNT